MGDRVRLSSWFLIPQLYLLATNHIPLAVRESSDPVVAAGLVDRGRAEKPPSLALRDSQPVVADELHGCVTPSFGRCDQIDHDQGNNHYRKSALNKRVEGG